MTDQHAPVAMIGGGLIGASWAALFLARGFPVVVQDPAAGFSDRVHRVIGSAWPDLLALGLAEADTPPLDRLRCAATVAEAVAGAGFIQECGPDRIAIKHAIVAEIEAAASPTVVIASSTSSLTASDIQDGARHPGRILVGHPFNPPHLIPLVEIVAGKATAPEAVATARAVYAALGREVIEVRKEAVGHVANRLSAALYREAVHMVAEGIASVEDIDRAVSFGPGLRWALMGPHLTYHLGGGEGGFRHYIRHLGPTQAARWATLGNPELTPEVIEALIQGVDEELAGLDAGGLERLRDEGLVAILNLKRRLGQAG